MIEIPKKESVSIWYGDVRLEGEFLFIDSDQQITIHPEITRKIRNEMIDAVMKGAAELMGGCTDGD